VDRQVEGEGDSSMRMLLVWGVHNASVRSAMHIRGQKLKREGLFHGRKDLVHLEGSVCKI